MYIHDVYLRMWSVYEKGFSSSFWATSCCGVRVTTWLMMRDDGLNTVAAIIYDDYGYLGC